MPPPLTLLKLVIRWLPSAASYISCFLPPLIFHVSCPPSDHAGSDADACGYLASNGILFRLFLQDDHEKNTSSLFKAYISNAAIEVTALYTFIKEWLKTDASQSVTDRLRDATLGQTMFRAPTITDIANMNNFYHFHLVVHISTVKAYRQNMKYQELAPHIQVLFDTIKKPEITNSKMHWSRNCKREPEMYCIILNEKIVIIIQVLFHTIMVVAEGKTGKVHWSRDFT